jgi:hypothetical protein
MQQARNLAWGLSDHQVPMRFSIRDDDTRFTRSFDGVFRAGGSR